MLEHERVSDVLKWYSLMKLIEKKYGIVKVLSPAVAFLVLVRPEYVRLISSEFNEEASFELSEQIVRLELAKRALSDSSYTSIQREEFETIMETNTEDQRVLIDENILPFEKFRKCGFDVSEKSFIDYLTRTNARGSVRHASSSHRHLALQDDSPQKETYSVTMDERTLQAYVFPQSQRNLKFAFACIKQLADARISMSYRITQRLGELFGVDSDPQWQFFLKILLKDSSTPRDDKSLAPNSVLDAINQSKDFQTQVPVVERSAIQIWEEQKRLEAEKQAEVQRKEKARKEELRRIEDEKRKEQQDQEEKNRIEELDRTKRLKEESILAEKERIYREEVQKKLEEELVAAKRREAQEAEQHRLLKLKEKFIEE